MKLKALRRLEFFRFLSPSKFRFLFLRNIALPEEKWEKSNLRKLYREFVRWTSKNCRWKDHVTQENSKNVRYFEQIFYRKPSCRVALIQVNHEVSSNISHQTKQRCKLTYKNIHTFPAAGPQNKPFPKKGLPVKKCILYNITKYQGDFLIDYKITPCKGVRIPESVKFFLVESAILAFGIQNPLKKDWNQLPGIWDLRRGILESKTDLDYMGPIRIVLNSWTRAEYKKTDLTTSFTRSPKLWVAIPGGGGGGYSTNAYTEKLCPEVQPFLLCTIFHKKGTPFVYHNNRTRFLCSDKERTVFTDSKDRQVKHCYPKKKANSKKRSSDGSKKSTSFFKVHVICTCEKSF